MTIHTKHLNAVDKALGNGWKFLTRYLLQVRSHDPLLYSEVIHPHLKRRKQELNNLGPCRVSSPDMIAQFMDLYPFGTMYVTIREGYRFDFTPAQAARVSHLVMTTGGNYPRMLKQERLNWKSLVHVYLEFISMYHEYDVSKLLRSPIMSRVRSLSLSGPFNQESSLEALVSSPYLDLVNHLALHGNPLAGKYLHAIVDNAAMFDTPCRLDVINSALSVETLNALQNRLSKHLTKFTYHEWNVTLPVQEALDNLQKALGGRG